MFVLIDTETGKPAPMRDGTPFTYTSRKLAEMGARFLAPITKAKYKITAL